MEIQISNLIDAYISFNVNFCSQGQAILNITWLADILESQAKNTRKIANRLREE